MINVYEKMAELVKSGTEFVFVVVVNAESSTAGKKGFKMVVLKDGTFYGTVGGGTLEKDALEIAKELFKTKGTYYKKYVLKEGDPLSLGMVCGGEVELYFEYVGTKKQMVIFGAGHLGKAIYEVAKVSNEYEFLVVDERPEFANAENFPNATVFSGEGVYRKVAELPIREGAEVVILTPGGENDPYILKGLYDKNVSYTYIGMIGSLNRRNKCFEKALELGVSKEFLDKIFAPVGLAIGSETPFEIAIAILGEIIALKKGYIDKVLTERSAHERT
jgi:Xanthine and CO dehydrogenases maturation factor, XdhC/CoxF family